MNGQPTPSMVTARFRGFLPVVVDVETGGFNAQTDALLEIAAVVLRVDARGRWSLRETLSYNVAPFAGAHLDRAALEFTGIDPADPLRRAVPEREALQAVFKAIRTEVKSHGCTRAVLVGHNPSFDLGFVNAAAQRCGLKRNPFHPFSSFDTATLGGLAFGQTVLSRACEAAGIAWDSRDAHCAAYDAAQTARLFCEVVNRWGEPQAGGYG